MTLHRCSDKVRAAECRSAATSPTVKQSAGKDAVQEAYRAGSAFLGELGITQQSELVRILDIGTQGRGCLNQNHPTSQR